MPFTWNAEADAQLLLAMIEVLNPSISRDLWEKLAKTMGQGLTSESVRCHVKKLKKKHLVTGRSKARETLESPVKAEREESGDSLAKEQNPVTPMRKTSSRKRTTNRYVDPEETEEDGGDAGVLETPAKKVKIEKTNSFSDSRTTGSLRWSE